jgi:superfamily II DNA or RNA helicase
MQEFIVRPNRTFCTTPDAISLIDNATAFYEEGYIYSPQFRRHIWDGKKHLYRKLDKSFPTGLLKRVCSTFDKKGLHYSIVEDFNAGKIDGYKGLHGLELRDYQLSALKEGLKFRYGIYHMATNAGKTAVMAALAQCIPGKVIVLTHRLELLHQTGERLHEWLGEPVGLIGDSAWNDKGRITIAMVPTIARRMKGDTKEAKFYRTEWLNQFNCIMVDECHHMGASTWYDIALRCPAVYRFGFSGTPIRTDNRDLMLEAATGPVLWTTTNKDLIDSGVSAAPTVKFIPISQPVLEKDLEWPDAYHNGIVVNTFRNAKAIDIAIGHYKEGRKVLLLVTEIDHGERLQAMLERRGILVAFVHGGCESEYRKKSLEEFKSKDGMNLLISSTILDEGVDIPSIDTLIMLGGGKSPIKLLQRIGRGLRAKEGMRLFVYDFLDLMDVDRTPPKRKDQKPKHGFLTLHGISRYTYLKEQPGFEVSLEK